MSLNLNQPYYAIRGGLLCQTAPNRHRVVLGQSSGTVGSEDLRGEMTTEDLQALRDQLQQDEAEHDRHALQLTWTIQAATGKAIPILLLPENRAGFLAMLVTYLNKVSTGTAPSCHDEENPILRLHLS